MKIFNTSEYSEKLKIKPVSVNNISRYCPRTKDELVALIRERIEKEGYTCDLNDINVSDITDMSYLFSTRYLSINDVDNFNCNISKWNVSNVTNMSCMFMYSHFNNDISEWDVSNVIDMERMFQFAKLFNQNLSEWNVSKCEYRTSMFENCPMENHPDKQSVFKK